MATFEIKGPDGNTYQIDGETEAGAIEALGAYLSQGNAMSEGLNALSNMTTNPQVVAGPELSLDDRISGFLRPISQKIDAMGNSVIRGATLGLMDDEARAGAASAMGFDYNENLQRERDQTAAFRESNPYSSAVGEVLGGVLSGGALVGGGARLGGGLLTKALSGMTAGVASGATVGFMEGEGGFSNRLENAVLPAVLGGSLGLAVGPLTAGAQRIYKRTAPGVAAAARNARRRLGLDENAARIVGEMVERDAPTTAQNFALAGDDAVNAMAGRNTKGLLDVIANRPGAAGAQVSRQIDDLAEGATTKFVSTVDDVLGQPVGVSRAQANIMRQTADERSGLYRAAYGQAIDYASDAGKELEGLVSRVPDDVIRSAERLMRTEGVSSAQRIARIADDGTVIFDTLPDVRQLDYITRALRDKGGFGVGEGAEQGRAFSGLARQIRSKLDDLAPEYAVARASGRDAILNREAVEFGESLLRARVPQDVALDTIEDMTQGELAFARQGVRSHIDEIMANTRAVMTDQNMDVREALRPLKDLSSRANRTKVTALLGESEAQRLFQSVDETFAALNLRAAISQNSKTAIRQGFEGVLDEAAGTTVAEAIENNGLTAGFMRAARPLISDQGAAKALRQDQVAESIGRVLMSPTRHQTRNIGLLQQLSPALRASDVAVEALGQRSRGLLGGLTGAIIQEAEKR